MYVYIYSNCSFKLHCVIRHHIASGTPLHCKNMKSNHIVSHNCYVISIYLFFLTNCGVNPHPKWRDTSLREPVLAGSRKSHPRGSGEQNLRVCGHRHPGLRHIMDCLGVFCPASHGWCHVATTYICIYKYISWYIYIYHIYHIYIYYASGSSVTVSSQHISSQSLNSRYLKQTYLFFPFSPRWEQPYTWVSYGRRNPWASQDQWPLTILNTRCLMVVYAFTSGFFGDHNHPLLLPLSTTY